MIDYIKTQVKLFEIHLQDKAPEFPHIWQIVERMAVKKEIKAECERFEKVLIETWKEASSRN